MKAIAKIYARRIHDGAFRFENVPEKYKDPVRSAYFDLFGEELN